MKVYGPPTNKIQKIQADNPTYFASLVNRSKYTQEEITKTLDEIVEINEELQAFLENAYDYLVWEDGEMMNHIYTGFASDNHKLLNLKLSEIDYISPNYSENSHLNCLPVRKWQKEVKSLKRQMKNIKNTIEKLN